MFYVPRIGWFPLCDSVANDIGKKLGLDPRRNLQAWGIRWLNFDVLFMVRETDWNEEVKGDIRQAEAFFEALQEAARPKAEPEVEQKKPARKRQKSGNA